MTDPDRGEAGRRVTIAQIQSAADVSEALRQMYGIETPRSEGVLHVTSVWDASAALVTMNINDRTPSSDHDLFALSASRAWSQVVVTSGKILRDEPQLRHEVQGPDGVVAALNAWRREVVGREAPAATLILTSGRQLDPGHPMFGSARRVIVFTASQRAAGLARALRRSNVDVVGVDRPSPRGAVEYLRARRAYRAISVELGPSTSAALYERPILVDELWLSVYSGPLPPSVRGKPFLDPREIHTVLPAVHGGLVSTGGTGRWTFSRHTPT